MVLLALAVTGCATTPPPPLQVPGLARSEVLKVVDARPAGETERKIFTLLITNDSYGIHRSGELGLQPTPLRLLQHRAFEQLGGNVQIKVHHFVMYDNVQAQFRAGAMGAVFGGGLGGLVFSQAAQKDAQTSVSLVDRAAFERLSGDIEWRRGLFTEQENPKKGPVFISYLDAEVDGRRAFVRVLGSTLAPEGQRPYVNALEATITHWLQAVAPRTEAAAAPAPAAAPAAPAAPVAAAPTTATSDAPARVRTLDAAMIEGRTWRFPHSRDPERFGQIRLQMAQGRVQASNARSHSSGTYTVQGEQLCVKFDATSWGSVCYRVTETTGADGATTLQVMNLPSGRSAPLTIE